MNSSLARSLLLAALLPAASGCTVIAVAGAVAGVGVAVASTAVSTGVAVGIGAVDVTTSVFGKGQQEGKEKEQ